MAVMQTADTYPSDHPSLAFEADLSLARRYVDAYYPEDAAQQQLKQRLLAFIDEHPEQAHLRRCRPGHLTASALVIARDDRKVLLMHHHKLQRWLQMGGHCDGDANLAAVALREASEESGLTGLVVDPRVVDIDIHPIPARPGEPAHLHYDCRFQVYAASASPPSRNEESDDLRWLDVPSALDRTDDDSVKRLLRLVAAEFRGAGPAS